MDKEELLRYWDYGHESGAGSDPGSCAAYREHVSDLIASEGVRTVLDLGCGDFEVGRSIDYRGARVTAVDGSSIHIARLSADPALTGITFLNEDAETFDMAPYDLVLCKDVIQHWPLDRVRAFLARPRPRLLLLTNDVGGGPVNGDIPYEPMRGGRLQVAVRGLRLNEPPFDLGGEVTLRFLQKESVLLRR